MQTTVRNLKALLMERCFENRQLQKLQFLLQTEQQVSNKRPVLRSFHEYTDEAKTVSVTIGGFLKKISIIQMFN